MQADHEEAGSEEEEIDHSWRKSSGKYAAVRERTARKSLANSKFEQAQAAAAAAAAEAAVAAVFAEEEEAAATDVTEQGLPQSIETDLILLQPNCGAKIDIELETEQLPKQMKRLTDGDQPFIPYVGPTNPQSLKAFARYELRTALIHCDNAG